MVYPSTATSTVQHKSKSIRKPKLAPVKIQNSHHIKTQQKQEVKTAAVESVCSRTVSYTLTSL